MGMKRVPISATGKKIGSEKKKTRDMASDASLSSQVGRGQTLTQFHYKIKCSYLCVTQKEESSTPCSYYCNALNRCIDFIFSNFIKRALAISAESTWLNLIVFKLSTMQCFKLLIGSSETLSVFYCRGSITSLIGDVNPYDIRKIECTALMCGWPNTALLTK